MGCGALSCGYRCCRLAGSVSWSTRPTRRGGVFPFFPGPEAARAAVSAGPLLADTRNTENGLDMPSGPFRARQGCTVAPLQCPRPPAGLGSPVWHRDDLNVVTTELDVPQPEDLPFSTELTQQIRDVARQVIRAVG